MLFIELDLEGHAFPKREEDHPFLAFRELLHSYRFARRRGVSDEDFVARVRAIDHAIEGVWGSGFRFSPLSSHRLEESGPAVWVKDETGNVSGSHKARHLMGIALHMAFAELGQPDLAISS